MALRILVVDDEPAVLKVMRRILEREGYEVETACDGEEALEKIFCATELFNLVLLDLNMPALNGWQFMQLKRMCARRLAQTAVVIVSGALNEERPEGVAVMFEKPVNLDQLLMAIKHFTNQTVPPPPLVPREMKDTNTPEPPTLPRPALQDPKEDE